MPTRRFVASGATSYTPQPALGRVPRGAPAPTLRGWRHTVHPPHRTPATPYTRHTVHPPHRTPATPYTGAGCHAEHARQLAEGGAHTVHPHHPALGPCATRGRAPIRRGWRHAVPRSTQRWDRVPRAACAPPQPSVDRRCRQGSPPGPPDHHWMRHSDVGCSSTAGSVGLRPQDVARVKG